MQVDGLFVQCLVVVLVLCIYFRYGKNDLPLPKGKAMNILQADKIAEAQEYIKDLQITQTHIWRRMAQSINKVEIIHQYWYFNDLITEAKQELHALRIANRKEVA